MTSLNSHERARFLLVERAIGALNDADANWLQTHLAECPACAQKESGLHETVQQLKQEPVLAPPFLAARTRASVHGRARQMAEGRDHFRLLSLVTAVTVLWTLLSTLGAYQVWQWSGGAMLGLSTTMWWTLAFTWLWIMPAVGGLAIAVMHRNGHGDTLQRWMSFANEGGSRE